MFDFVKDDWFDIEKTKYYKISIQVSLDGFSFLIIHTAENRIVAFKNTPLKISSANLVARRLKEWLELEEILKNPFESVQVFIFAENFTLFPEEYFEEEQRQDLPSMLFQEVEGNYIIETKIASLNARFIFPIPSEINDVLGSFFTEIPEIIHPVAKLLQAPVTSKKRNCAVIISTGKYFFLIVTQNNKLLLANSFQTAHKNDLVYNILNTFQQLEATRSETELYVAGSNTQNSKIEDLLKPYFENIALLKTEGIVINPEITNQFLQLYLTLI
jgi:hypothetical protein